MKQLLTTGIILTRTDFGEADRIITLLTPDYGKLRLVAKGVRRIKSKMAGGIELFSISHIAFMQGKGELGTLLSTRLQTHYGHIINNIDRTMLGYALIKQLNRAIEDEPGPEYFTLLQQAFAALDDPTIDTELIRLWFSAQLMSLDGHTPNLSHEHNGTKLSAGQQYEFSFDDTSFVPCSDGTFTADDIKFLRLVFIGNQPAVLQKVTGVEQLVSRSTRLVTQLAELYIH